DPARHQRPARRDRRLPETPLLGAPGARGRPTAVRLVAVRPRRARLPARHQGRPPRAVRALGRGRTRRLRARAVRGHGRRRGPADPRTLRRPRPRPRRRLQRRPRRAPRHPGHPHPRRAPLPRRHHPLRPALPPPPFRRL
ncbi:MAG: hypothetical protein AVDCRST_MAG25-563, partial [uncultured Rubrobacteraceae bacterium]